MDERSGTIRLVEPTRDSEARGLAATVSRAEVEKALRSDEGPVDLLLDIERATSEGRETQRIALGWETQDLERLLETTDASEISLTFDEGELQRPSEISTGIVGETAAAPSEISTGIVQEPRVTPAEVTTGITAKPTAEPVSADQPSWSPSTTEGVALAGTILALTAVGFAMRSRRGPTVAT